MAVSPSICVESDKNSLYVYDTTGGYSGKNTGGWGGPNKSVSEVDSTLIQVWTPHADNPKEFSVYPALPNKEGIGYEITDDMIGMSGIESGIYRVRVKFEDEDDVDDSGNVWSAKDNAYHFAKTSIYCCLRDMHQQVNVIDDQQKADELFKMEMLLDTAIWKSCYNGQMDHVQTIADYLNLNCKC